jgi:predicted AAA+ superfamily ATPase
MVYSFPKNLKPRGLFDELIPFLDEKEIVLLYGMRQTGKTSLLYLLANYLTLKRRVDRKQVVYFDLENVSDYDVLESLKDYDQFIQLLKDRHKADLKKRVYVFIDEIQHLYNPSSFLKYLYDHYNEKIKFVVTGSSSLEIKKKFTDALTGRIFRFEVLPLDFHEFIDFSGLTPSPASFERFVIFGGFPAVVLKKEPQIRMKLLKDIYSPYVRRDIRDLGAMEDVLSFNKLITLLAARLGGLISETSLSNVVGISRPTVKNYLFILQNTFVITLLTPFFTNPKKEVTKAPKIYFSDSGIRNAVVDNFAPLFKRKDAGNLVENTVFSELKKSFADKVHFWRSEEKQEVDFIVEKDSPVPVEVKYQSFKKPIIPESLIFFIKKYRPDRAFVLTKDFEEKSNFGQTKVFFSPCWRIDKVVKQFLF